MTTIHLVSHTHWDREWYLPFQQFRLKLVHLLDHLLALLDSDPDFVHFTLDGQTIVLDDYLHMRPEQEANLRRHIQSGRLLIGPWHILPDEFLVSPEATIRNLLEGDRTSRKFGPKMNVGYIPDPFGHVGQMPQILQGFGIQTACVQRGLSGEPAEFWWQAPDGSRVFMAYLRDGYGNAAGLPTSEPERFTSEVKRLADSLLAHSACTSEAGHVLLMHGTDHTEPPADTSGAIGYAQKHLEGHSLLHSTLPAYLDGICRYLAETGNQIPTITGELRACQRSHLLPGVLSARMWIKQRNQACQTLLERWAEPFSLWASLVQNGGSPALPRLDHPEAILHQAWRLLMECHPHDSICGCSVDQTHAEMQPRFDQVEQIGEEIVRQSLAALASQADTRTPGPAFGAVLVFNPLPVAQSGLAQVEVHLPEGVEAFKIVDEQGQAVPLQAAGLASHDLMNVMLDRDGLKAALGMIHEGRVAGMVVRSAHIRREGELVRIEASLGQEGKPADEAIQQAMTQILALASDPSVKQFHVRGRLEPAAEASFVAPQVPGLGFRTFWLVPTQATGAEPAAVKVSGLALKAAPLAAKASGLPGVKQVLAKAAAGAGEVKEAQAVIENEFFTVRARASDGTFTLTDKRSGAVYEGLNRFVDGGDCGDEYNFCPPAHDSPARLRVRGLRAETGPALHSLEMRLELSLPRGLAPDRKARLEGERVTVPVISRATLVAGVPVLEFHTEVENTAQDHRLRVHFPAPFAAQDAWHDGHFEIVHRPVGVSDWDESWVEHPRPEVPQRLFTAVSNGQAGLMVANRGLPEVEALTRPDGRVEIALTLLRCVGWLSRDDFSNRRGHAGPALETPGAQMLGRHEFDYAVIPYTAQNSDALGGLPFNLAYAFNAPLRAVATGLHAGPLGAQAGLASVEPQAFAVSAIKAAEDGRGWVLRGANLSPEPITVRVAPLPAFRRAEKVSLAEEPLEDLQIESGAASLTLRGHEIATLRFYPPMLEEM